jgi:hypothetical protein
MTIPCSYPHCGITVSGSVVREGHCPCPECHGLGGKAPASRIIRTDVSDQPVFNGRGTPMCERWYERAGDYRPWQAGTHDLAAQQDEFRREQQGMPDQLLTPAPAHDRGRIIAEVALDKPLAGSVTRVRLTAPVPVPDVLSCPQCGDKTFLDAADPDDDLAAFWHHLGQHTQDPMSRLRLWTTAMGGEEAGGP